MNPILAVILASSFVGAAASDPPPIQLYDSGGTVCLKLSENGAVTDAFMGRSTGSARKDRDFLKWAKGLSWSEDKQANEQRGTWFPMSLMTKIPKKPIINVDCTALVPTGSDRRPR